MIYCTNCGKQIDDDSKFCSFCGAAVVENEKAEVEDNTQQNSPLWDKFVEIRDAKGEKGEKYLNFIPDATWTVMKNMRENVLDELKQAYPEEIGNLPYKDVEIILSFFSIAQRDGYIVKLSNRLLKDSRIKKAKDLTVDHLVSRWQKELDKDVEKVTEPEELNILNLISVFDIDQVLEDEKIKELPNKVIESIKTDFYKLTYWGFILALVEEKLQK